MMQATENGHATNDQQILPGPGAIVPAGPVKSVLPSPNLVGFKVDTQTRAIGLIQPPPDIRAIVDKTAQFVAKNGTQFEGRILANEKDNPKFNFLRTADPYHAYYRHMVTEDQKGTHGAKPAAAAQSDQQTAEQQQLAAGPAAGAVTVEPPEEEKYSVHVPEGLTYFDLDLIKMTAQFVARNGKGFLTGLAGKEHSNPQFMFLKPTHSMFGFFTSLCDAYSRVLMPDKGLMQKLHQDASDRTAILERCLRRLEFDKARDAAAKAQADQLEAERMAMQSIDWHDFVVVETIEFDEDEDDELPMLLTQRDVVLMNKAGPLEEDDAEPAAQLANGDAQTVEMSEEERAMVAEADAAAAPVTTAADRAPEGVDAEQAIEEQRLPEAAPAPQGAKDEDMDMDVDEEPMRIVRNYQRHDARANPSSRVAMSPITGELIPVDQMAEHMRISLIDPKFQQQREAMMSKIRETTKAGDDEIGRNLIGLARKRPDVFGSTEEEMGALVQQSINDSKISGGDRPVAWDGETRSGAGLQNQLKQIHDSKSELGKRKEPDANLPPPPRLGPQPPQPSSLPPPVMRPTPAAPRPGPTGPQVPGAAPQSLPPPPVMPPRQQAPPQLPPPAQGPPQLAPPQMRPPGFPLVPPQMPPMMLGGLPRPMIPGMPMGAPPAGPPPMGPPPGGPPDAKRQRREGLVLEPEEEFLQKYPGPSKVLLLCPNTDESEMLNGQLLEVEVASLQDTVGELKSRLAEVVGIAANKQKIGRDQLGFLKDELTLAHYNVSPDIQLTLGVKERGGRKK
ncbi:hypothetical protein WJX77_008545 [Trebouxia sp. C0004]